MNARAQALGYTVQAAIEYEFFFFREDPQSVRQKHYHDLTPLSPGMFGYSVVRSSVHSDLVHMILDAARALGIDVEGFHTETGPGVYEAAIRYAEALSAADQAALFKLVVKAVAAEARTDGRLHGQVERCPARMQRASSPESLRRGRDEPFL